MRFGSRNNCSLSENICTIPKATDFSYNFALTADAPPHHEGIEKYALAADVPVGMVIIRLDHCAFHVLVM